MLLFASLHHWLGLDTNFSKNARNMFPEILKKCPKYLTKISKYPKKLSKYLAVIAMIIMILTQKERRF